jgi:beta-alanine--pyruvate transaminase
LGAPFASHTFDVVPDMITLAKGLTNGSVPMGAVLVRNEIYDAFMTGPESAIELFHGYTYSGHPLASAAANAALDIYQEEGLLTRGAELARYWEDGLHNLRGLPHVIDIRNLGLVGAIELEPIAGKPAQRASETFRLAFDKGVLIRTTGDTIALSPPLIVETTHIDRIMETLADVLRAVR